MRFFIIFDFLDDTFELTITLNTDRILIDYIII